jgi:hypothetical protein
MNATTVSHNIQKEAFDTFVKKFATANAAVMDFEDAYTAEWAKVISPMWKVMESATLVFGLTDDAEGRFEATKIVAMAMVQHLPTADVTAYEVVKAVDSALRKNRGETIKVVERYAKVKAESLTRLTFVRALDNIERKPGTPRGEDKLATSAFNRLFEKGGIDHLTEEQWAVIETAVAARLGV